MLVCLFQMHTTAQAKPRTCHALQRKLQCGNMNILSSVLASYSSLPKQRVSHVMQLRSYCRRNTCQQRRGLTG